MCGGDIYSVFDIFFSYDCESDCLSPVIEINLITGIVFFVS